MFQYRIYPTRRQETRLNETLEECRWLYNHLLEKRKTAYEQDGISLSLYQQHATYPLLKQERPSLLQVHSQVLQNVAVRLDLAFKAFFAAVKPVKSLAILALRGRVAMTRSRMCDTKSLHTSGLQFTLQAQASVQCLFPISPCVAGNGRV
jgi:hypothetical protein